VRLFCIGFLLANCATAEPSPHEPRAQIVGPISADAVQRLPLEEVKERIVQQFGAILITPEWYTTDGKKPLSRLEFKTRASATYTPGVCRFDVIAFNFKTLGDDRGAATPVTVQSISPSAYLVVVNEIGTLNELDEAGRRGLDAECANLTPKEGDSVEVPSEKVGLDALTMLQRVQQVSDDELKRIDIACNVGEVDFPGTKDVCRTVLRSIEMKTAWRVADTFGCDNREPITPCVMMNFDSYLVVMFRAWGDNSARLPSRVLILQYPS
jgi:hypothetical protein